MQDLKFDLNLFRCFSVVAEAKSISEASKTLHLSQPAISLQIRRLEEQLGKKLFDRNNRGLSLTPIGNQLLTYSRKMFDLEEEIKSLVLNKSKEPTGPIRVGTYTTASSYLLARPVSSFLKEQKRISISFDYDTCENMLTKLKKYELDCAVFTDVPNDPELNIQHLFSDRLILAQSAKEPVFKRKKIKASDLAKVDFISYPLRYDLCYQKVEKLYGRHLAKAHVVAESESFDTIRELLINGAGVTFIPKYLVEEELANGLLDEIDIQNIKLPITFSFISRNSTENTEATQAFSRHLATYFDA